MESILDGLNRISELIIWPYLGIFILFSYLLKNLLGNWLNSITRFKWKQVYTVLIIATIIAIPYIILTDVGWERVLLTYAVGTSFYETLLQRIIGKTQL